MVFAPLDFVCKIFLYNINTVGIQYIRPNNNKNNIDYNSKNSLHIIGVVLYDKSKINYLKTRLHVARRRK